MEVHSMKLSGIFAPARSRLPLHRLCKSDRKLLLTSLSSRGRANSDRADHMQIFWQYAS